MRYVMTSFPRTGTHYVKAVLSKLIGKPPLEEQTSLNPSREKPPAYDLRRAIRDDARNRLVYDHYYFEHDADVIDRATFPDLRIVVLTRHPLDRLLSVFAYSAWKGLLSDNYSSYQEMTRDWLLGRNNGKYLTPNMQIDDFAIWQRAEVENYGSAWIRLRGGHQVKFENLLENPHDTFTKMLRYFSVPYNAAKLERILVDNSFDSLSGGRRRGEVDLQSHYRAGLTGEFKRVFSDVDLREIRAIYGEVFAELGYEI